MKSSAKHMMSSNGRNLAEGFEGWNTLFAKYYGHLKSFSLRLTGNPTDAEDLAQEVVCRVLKYVNRADGSEHHWKLRSPEAYLKKVARNIHFDRMRERSCSHISLDDDENGEDLQRQLVDHSSPNAIFNGVYYKELMQSLPLSVILTGLSRYELKLLELNCIEERNVREIAETLNEDASRIRYDLQKVHAKTRYRARKLMNGTLK